MFDIDLIDLNPLEMELYQYIIQNKEKVMYMRIRELSTETHVSTTTVLRLCKKLGCEGFAEFKTRLKMYINENIEVTNNSGDVLEELFARLKDTDLNEKIKEAQNLIKEYETIFVVGVGNSSHVASYAGRYISNFEKIAVVIDSPYHPLTAKSIKNSVAIVFSVSGESSDVIRISKELKSRGVKLIAITNSSTSTLSKLSDLTIAYYIQRWSKHRKQTTTDMYYLDFTSQVPALYIAERLANNT